MDRVRLPLLFLLGIGLVLAGCDAFGGSEGDGPGGASPLAVAWTGTYDGTGQETDYYGPRSSAPIDIEPTLTVGVRDSSLKPLELSWEENGASRGARTTGEPKEMTTDTLVTPFVSVDADSFQTEYQFRLGRDTVAGGDSIRVRGTLDQQYQNTEADSTLVQFTVFRSTQQ
ncbi:hypothetical protein BSZ35_07370 [Salinibacter sp. 10B]|uniref:hypothetical protein n=1 Tax=Salinibacter sp. 10B TaxID=1923971 RepID=UPI000CF38E50|nr:hypothetical protein [Salinibacter sp. 10B]PQJ34444.1 hypothetical protein BSZ35_07370 [Salinibacter sp. 10B]